MKVGVVMKVGVCTRPVHSLGVAHDVRLASEEHSVRAPRFGGTCNHSKTGERGPRDPKTLIL